MAYTALNSPLVKLVHRLIDIPLSPLLSGPLLFAITYAPDAVRHVLESAAAKLPIKTPDLSAELFQSAKVTLRVLLALGLVRWINRGLNSMASNAWRLAPRGHWNWSDEIAVVTGGSSGIGKDIVKKLSAMGIRVAILDIQGPKDKDLLLNPLVRYYACDITDTKSLAAAADSLRTDFGHPTILINNAGITQPTPILTIPESFLRKIIGVNLMANWFTAQEFLPRMIQLDKGHIITVASIASFVALPAAADYSATKSGALVFHEALTTEIKYHYKSPGILTTVVHPSYVRTPLLDEHSQRLEDVGVKLLDSEYVAEQIVGRIKGRRGGQLIIGAPGYLAGMRGWPTWVQEAIRDSLGKVHS